MRATVPPKASSASSACSTAPHALCSCAPLPSVNRQPAEVGPHDVALSPYQLIVSAPHCAHRSYSSPAIAAPQRWQRPCSRARWRAIPLAVSSLRPACNGIRPEVQATPAGRVAALPGTFQTEWRMGLRNGGELVSVPRQASRPGARRRRPGTSLLAHGRGRSGMNRATRVGFSRQGRNGAHS